MNNEEKNNPMIPIRDGRGNFLSIGNEVLFTGIRDMKHIVGKVISFDPGGMSVIESNDSKPKQTMSKLRVVFDMVIQIPPNSPYVIDIFRIINPDSETVLSKILESDLKPKIQ